MQVVTLKPSKHPLKHPERRHYRIRGLTSQEDETLVDPKQQSRCDDTKQTETQGNSGTTRSKSGPHKTHQQNIRIIPKDRIRNLKIAKKDPSEHIILSPAMMERITVAARVTTKEEMEAAREALQERRDAAMDAMEERKALIHEADLSRKKNHALNDIEADARDRAQYALNRANAMRMEQEGEIRRLNTLILGAQCLAGRDAQILEKTQIRNELVDDERRLHGMMELDCSLALQTQSQIDDNRKQQRMQGQQQILVQIEERQMEKLLQQERTEQEGKHVLEKMERKKLDAKMSLARKKEEQQLLQDEIMRINAESLRVKERKKKQEKMADHRAMEFTQQKMQSEAEYKAEQSRAKKEKEKGVARLRGLQERDRDQQAEKDELRVRRNQEELERQCRKKEKEKSKRKAEEEVTHKAGLCEQVVHKEHRLSIQAGRARAEFETLLRAQQEAITKQKEEEKRQHQRAMHNAAGVRQQIREREHLAVIKREQKCDEIEKVGEEAHERRARMDKMKEKKLRELRAAGLAEKYCNQVERNIPNITEQ